MRILLVHNYVEGRATGGEGHVFEDEASQLVEGGHAVFRLECSNSEVTRASLVGKVRHFLTSPWSRKGRQRMENAIAQYQPDIIHVHNFFLVLSPAIFRAARNHGIPVVVTLHNYRLVVPCSQLLRKGKVCEKCLGKNPWRILLYRCYRGSLIASLLRYRFYYVSQKIHRWWYDIDRFIALTEFGKEVFVRGGLPPQCVVVKPNSVPDPPEFKNTQYPGHGALYVGRLTPEKGVRELVAAWDEIEYPLTVLGNGCLKGDLVRHSSRHVCFKGVVSREEVNRHLAECAFVVVPSVWYEGFGLVMAQAFAMGKPVVASNVGAMKSIVVDGQNGLHFEVGDIADLRRKIAVLIEDPSLRTRLGRQAREDYLRQYTPARNYERLMEIYHEAIAVRRASRGKRRATPHEA